MARKGNGVRFPTSTKGDARYRKVVMTNSDQRRGIIAGPSREELFDALRLRHEGRKVTFTVARVKLGSLSFEAQLDMLRPEDGGGNNWLFELSNHNIKPLGSSTLRGYINTTKREGWVEPIVS